MADFLFLEQLNKMIHEIPKPRLMYKKGTSVKGYFKPYMTFRDYTQAEIFSNPEDAYPVDVRFSSMLGEEGTADSVRNIKGLSVRFYSSSGKFDLICRSLPVFFINSGGNFLKLAEAFTGERPFDGINKEKFWSFVTGNPEAANCALRMFSCKGLLNSYIRNEWYSANTYIWENSEEKKLLARYKWSPVNQEKSEGKTRQNDRIFAEFMAGFDPDTAGDELKNLIMQGDFPAFELSVQMADYRFITHPEYLKQTISWNESVIPSVKVGVMKLTDLAAEKGGHDFGFAPGNVIKGMSLCGDEFSKIMDHAHKIGAMERGAGL